MDRKFMLGSSTPSKNFKGLDKQDPNFHLYEAIINDPNKKAMVLKLLSQEKHLIKDYLRKESKTSAKRLHFESPTALYKRKLLEKKHSEQESDNCASSIDNISVVPSPVPFEKLLEGVIAYVEVKTKNGDRTSATKAVVASMGATIREQLTKDVTHVIFKDGSYSTYQKAKLIKAHLVSLLWIEAVRNNRVRVPEKDYPPLGIEAFNANLSLLCQQMQEEYEEALQDEVNQTLHCKSSLERKRISRRVTALPTELTSVSKRNSVNDELCRKSIQSFSEESSSSSDCGVIDGEITKKITQKLELSSSLKENSIMKSIENFDSKSSDLSSKNNTGDTSNGSISLLDIKNFTGKKKRERKSKENASIDMDLTEVAGNFLEVTSENKPVKESSERKGRSKQRLFTNNSILSSDSDVTKLSDNVMEKLAIRNRSSGEMSSLKLSSSKNDDVKETPLSPRQHNFASENVNTSSPLKLPSEIDSSKDEEESTCREKRKTNYPLSVSSSPSKKRKNDTQNKTVKKTCKRRLYNPDEELDGSNLREKDDTINKRKQNIVFKKPTVLLTPVLLTTKAKMFLERKQDTCNENQVNESPIKNREKISHNNVENKDGDLKIKTQSTPKKPITVTRATRSTTKKPQAACVEPKKRSSSFYFDKTRIKRTQQKNKKITSIVCTRLHRPEVELFEQIVKRLGGFFVEDEVSNSTSHLVAGESKRTINLLRALARGCWILKYEWVLRSLEAGKWLSEEEYELTEFSNAVQRCRIERQAFGSNYTIDIFRNCGYIYVARSTIPRCSDLQELVRTCKGKITASSGRAKIIVGEHIDSEDTVCVKETWILDSIADNKLKPTKDYVFEK